MGPVIDAYGYGPDGPPSSPGSQPCSLNSVHEVERVGLRTIFFDARNGNVLFEKIDREVAPN
jgi:hypothetical protein